MKIIKIISLSVLSLIAGFGIVFIILLFFGYRPVITQTVDPDWEPINTIAACASALGAVLVPVAIFIVDKRMKDRSDAVQAKILDDLSAFKEEYGEKLKTLSKIVADDGTLDGSQIKNTPTYWG